MASGSTHILDALCATYELASRAESGLATWRKGHSRTAPRAADSLARLGASIAAKVKVDTQLAAASLPGVDLTRVRSLNGRTSAVVELATVLDHSTHDSTHPVLSPTVQTLLNDLGIAGQVLVIGTREMSYELSTLIRHSFEPIASQEVCDAIEWPIFIFSVPHPPLDWSLHHAVLFHEIGHALFPRAPLTTIQIPVPAEFDPNATMDLAVRAQRIGNLARFQKWFQSWAEELFSDAVGCIVGGTAFLHSFCRVLGSFYAFDESSPSHPPTALRAHLGGNILSARGLLAGGNQASILGDWIAEAAAIHSSTSYINRDAQAQLLSPVLVREIEAVHPLLVKAAEAALNGRSYSPILLNQDIARAENMSVSGVPPSEEPTVPSLTSGPEEPLPSERIFSIAWQAFCSSAQGFPDASSAQRSVRRAEALLEALDGAEAIRAWKRAK